MMINNKFGTDFLKLFWRNSSNIDELDIFHDRLNISHGGLVYLAKIQRKTIIDYYEKGDDLFAGYNPNRYRKVLRHLYKVKKLRQSNLF